MCRIEEKVYIGADGRSRKFQDTFECDRARRRGKKCSKPEKRTREYIGAPPIAHDDAPSPASNNPPTPTRAQTYFVEERRPSSSGRRPSLRPTSGVKPGVVIQIGSSKKDKEREQKYPRTYITKSYKRTSLGGASVASNDAAVESPGSDASFTLRTGLPETNVPPFSQPHGYATRHAVPQGHRPNLSVSSVTTSQTPSLYTTSETEPESPLGASYEYPRTIVHNTRNPSASQTSSQAHGSVHSNPYRARVETSSSRDTSLSREAAGSNPLFPLDYSDAYDVPNAYAPSHTSSSNAGSSRAATSDASSRFADQERRRKKKEEEKRKQQEEADRKYAEELNKQEQAKQVRFAEQEIGRYEDRERLRNEQRFAESEKHRAEEREKERQRKKEKEQEEREKERQRRKEQEKRAAAREAEKAAREVEKAVKEAERRAAEKRAAKEAEKRAAVEAEKRAAMEAEKRATREPEKRATKKPEREKTQPPVSGFSKKRPGGGSRRNSMTQADINEQNRLLLQEKLQITLEREAADQREREERAAELRQQQYATRPQSQPYPQPSYHVEQRAPAPPVRRPSVSQPNPPSSVAPVVSSFPQPPQNYSTRPQPTQNAGYTPREQLPSARYSPSRVADDPFSLPPQRISDPSMDNPFAQPSTRPIHPTHPLGQPVLHHYSAAAPHSEPVWDTRALQGALPPSFAPGSEYFAQGQRASGGMGQGYGGPQVKDEWM